MQKNFFLSNRLVIKLLFKQTISQKSSNQTSLSAKQFLSKQINLSKSFRQTLLSAEQFLSKQINLSKSFRQNSTTSGNVKAAIFISAKQKFAIIVFSKQYFSTSNFLFK